MRYYFCIVITAFVFASCVKDKPLEPEETPVSIGSGHKVYITNEGNFMSNNASVSLYDVSSGSVVTDIYKSQNNNAALGDVCQSLIKANNSFYVVVNNSGKIVVTSSSDFKHKATISGLTSPRYMLPVTFQKCYVSDYSSNSISVLDLNSNSKTGTISCSGWTEQMAVIYNKAFVTNMKRNYTYVINTINDQITDSINVGINSGSIVIDKNSKVWILSSGDKANNVQARLSKIDPVTLQVEQSLNFGTSDGPGNLCINAGKDTLYFLNTHVYRMPVSSSALPSIPFINSNANVFYGLGINDKDHTIYVSDAIDYIQKSSIMVYNSSGQLKTTFKAGINASGFYFE
jgi:hypothetical protein